MDTKPHRGRLLFAALLATGIAAGAGAAHAADIGAQLGVNRSGIDGDRPPNTGYSTQFGLVAGVQGEIGIGQGLSLSLQPSFDQRKTLLRISPSNSGGSTTELDLTFDYVSVPVLLKFAKAGGRTYVAGGVTLDFLAAATLSGQGSDRDVASAYNSTGLAGVLGFGVVFPAGRTRFTTELRYVQGISNMTTGTAAASAGALAPRLHSTGFELILGSLIPIGRH